MKRIFICGAAMVASFGMATSASAQYGSNHQYSSYGYRGTQEAQDAVKDALGTLQEASPSDLAIPAPAVPSVPMPPLAAQPYQQSPVGGCDTGSTYAPSSVYSGGDGGACGSGVYSGGAANGGSCGGGGLGSYFGLGGGGGRLGGSSDRNIVFGLRGLIFERDYEDDRGLGSNGAGEYLFSTDSDHGSLGGFETTLGIRNCSGSGYEFSYWGLFADEADVTFNGPGLATTLTGLSAVDLNGFTMDNILNTADSWRLYRRSEMHNVELNVLRNAGQARGLFGGCTNIEWIGGFRWLKFSEDMRLASNNSNGGYPTNAIYDVDVENNLVGFQLGARADRCIGNGLSLTAGTKFGVYNNNVYTRQRIADNATGTVATVPSGPVDYSFGARKDDIATLGELDLGLNYQFSCNWRANVGYRAIGVSSVALAYDQIPNNFNDTQNIQRVKSNGSLLLHGAYFGIERSF